MRSSKSRSRSKQNRPRTIGNIVNRVFDSSGPEGKVRGTPQQIIEKYQALARDAQLSNDRVAAENFLQHAEHYTRMLGEAMREMAVEQEARRQHQGGHGSDRGYAPRRDERDDEQPDIGAGAYGFTETVEEGESVLIETPEAREAQPPREPRYENRRQDRRDDNRRDDTRRDENRRDDNRREERRYDAPRRDDNRGTERRDEPRTTERREDTRGQDRRDDRPAREDGKPYAKRPRRDEDRRVEEPAVVEAPVVVEAVEQPVARPVLSIDKPRTLKVAPRARVESVSEAAASMVEVAPSAPEGEAVEKPKRPRAPRKPREAKPEAAE